MAKKTDRKARTVPPRQAARPVIAAQRAPESGGDAFKRRALWLAAVILIIAGYALLHKADPGGQNTWAIVSPALLLCGYLLIVPAIMYTYRG